MENTRIVTTIHSDLIGLRPVREDRAFFITLIVGNPESFTTFAVKHPILGSFHGNLEGQPRGCPSFFALDSKKKFAVRKFSALKVCSLQIFP